MPDIDQQLTELLAKGDRIGAIKTLRDYAGLGHAEAKQAVERIEAGEPLPQAKRAPELQSSVETAALPEDVQAHMLAGRKIKAIQLLREQTGIGLAEAKKRVEDAAGPQAKSGCSAALLLAAMGCATLWILR
jgi:ribosomal protein L7/L12